MNGARNSENGMQGPRTRASLLALLAALTAACQAQSQPVSAAPDAGKGAVAHDEPTAGLRFALCPDGSAVVADAAACSLAMLGTEAARWRKPLEGCKRFLDVSVALNSVVYARAPAILYAFAPDGRELWRLAIPAVDASLASPTTTRDSLVVVATSASTVVATNPEGQEAWRFSLPTGEALVASPVGSQTEGVVLLSQSATYFVGANGVLRARRVHLAVRR
jgi:hypothetical protein